MAAVVLHSRNQIGPQPRFFFLGSDVLERAFPRRIGRARFVRLSGKICKATAVGAEYMEGKFRGSDVKPEM